MKKNSSETAISILAMIQAGIYTIGEICAAHNINRRTFTRWRAKYPRFAQAIEDLRIDAIDKMNIEARNGLMKRLKGCDIQIVAVKRDNKGNIIKQGTTSPYSIYNESIASFTTGDLYDHHDASGFITLYGLSTKVRAMKLAEAEKN